MRNALVLGLISLALLHALGLAGEGQAASFDCNKATTETEVAICSDRGAHAWT